MSSKARLWILAFVVAAAVAVVVPVALRYHVQSEKGWYTVVMKRQLHHMALLVFGKAFWPVQKPLDLPRGDVRELYTWAMRDPVPPEEEWYALLGDTIDRGSGTFRDLWGNELVYRFPARRPGAIFDLYSVGPNGVDESGGIGDHIGTKAIGQPPFGDDITCVPWADFKVWSHEFKGGIVDPAWVKVHVSDLKRDPETGKIIGVPPGKLENAED